MRRDLIVAGRDCRRKAAIRVTIRVVKLRRATQRIAVRVSRAHRNAVDGSVRDVMGRDLILTGVT